MIDSPVKKLQRVYITFPKKIQSQLQMCWTVFLFNWFHVPRAAFWTEDTEDVRVRISRTSILIDYKVDVLHLRSPPNVDSHAPHNEALLCCEQQRFISKHWHAQTKKKHICDDVTKPVGETRDNAKMWNKFYRFQSTCEWLKEITFRRNWNSCCESKIGNFFVLLFLSHFHSYSLTLDVLRQAAKRKRFNGSINAKETDRLLTQLTHFCKMRCGERRRKKLKLNLVSLRREKWMKLT